MPETKCAAGGRGDIKEAVTINASRIFDSCRDRDCVEGLPVFFAPCDQAVIDSSLAVRPADAAVLWVTVEVEPVAFNRGFYSVHLTYYIKLEFAVSLPEMCAVRRVSGLCCFEKTLVLCGSDSSTRIFSSDEAPRCCHEEAMPRASVEVAKPVVLHAELMEPECEETCPCPPPPCVMEQFPEPVAGRCGAAYRLYVTIGIFSVVRMESDVPILVPIYEYSLPEKTCCHEDGECGPVTPSSLFESMDFPIEEFYPTSACLDKEPCEETTYHTRGRCCR